MFGHELLGALGVGHASTLFRINGSLFPETLKPEAVLKALIP